MHDAGKPTYKDREVFENALMARFPGTLADLLIVDPILSL
jgi:hypothetical protein